MMLPDVDTVAEAERLCANGFWFAPCSGGRIGAFFPEDAGAGIYRVFSERLSRLYRLRIKTHTNTYNPHPTEPGNGSVR